MAGGHLGPVGWFGLLASSVLEKIVAFKQLADDLDGEHHIIADQDLSKAEIVSLSAIRQAQSAVFVAIRQVHRGATFRTRRVHVMISETADGFTGGKTNIYIHKKYLSGLEYGPARAISWAVEVANLLVHEYLHDDNNGTGCVHDAEFHEMYHVVTSSHEFAEAVRHLFDAYADRVRRAPLGIFSRTLDRLAVIEDKVGGVEPALARSLKERKPRPRVEASLESFYGGNHTPVREIEIVDGFDLTSD